MNSLGSHMALVPGVPVIIQKGWWLHGWRRRGFRASAAGGQQDQPIRERGQGCLRPERRVGPYTQVVGRVRSEAARAVDGGAQLAGCGAVRQQEQPAQPRRDVHHGDAESARMVGRTL